MKSVSKWMLAMSLVVWMSADRAAQDPAAELRRLRARADAGHGFGPGPFGERMELLGFGGMHAQV